MGQFPRKWPFVYIYKNYNYNYTYIGTESLMHLNERVS